jgi:hypothetical protein
MSSFIHAGRPDRQGKHFLQVDIVQGFSDKDIQRDDPDNEEWISVEKYLKDTSATGVSHGICKDCARSALRRVF